MEEITVTFYYTSLASSFVVGFLCCYLVRRWLQSSFRNLMWRIDELVEENPDGGFPMTIRIVETKESTFPMILKPELIDDFVPAAGGE